MKDELFYYNPVTGVKFGTPLNNEDFKSVVAGLYKNGEEAWRFNPYTGGQRRPEMIQCDPHGIILVHNFDFSNMNFEKIESGKVY